MRYKRHNVRRIISTLLSAEILLCCSAGCAADKADKHGIDFADVTKGLVCENVPDWDKDNIFWYSTDEKYAAIVEAARGECETNNRAVVFMLATDGGVIAIAGLNAAERDGQTNVNAYTTFEIGSITKMFTAAAVLQLAEQGKLSLDDRLGKYFPEYEKGADITLYQLLHMQSGIYDYVNDTDVLSRFLDDDGQDAGIDRDKLRKAISELKARGNTDIISAGELLPLIFALDLKYEPGSEYRYSNTNYLLLAMIIEKITGDSYAGYIQKNIFDVCGMDRSSSMTSGDVTSVPVLGDYTPDTSLNMGAGDIHSCAADLLAFDIALHGGKILSDKSLSEMFDMDMGYGCGWMEYPNAPEHHYHFGRIGSYLSCNTVLCTEKYGRVYYIQLFPKNDGYVMQYSYESTERIRAAVEK